MGRWERTSTSSRQCLLLALSLPPPPLFRFALSFNPLRQIYATIADNKEIFVHEEDQRLAKLLQSEEFARHMRHHPDFAEMYVSLLPLHACTHTHTPHARTHTHTHTHHAADAREDDSGRHLCVCVCVCVVKT